MGKGLNAFEYMVVDIKKYIDRSVDIDRYTDIVVGRYKWV